MEAQERKRLTDEVCRGSPEAWEHFVDLTLGVVLASVRKTLSACKLKPVDAVAEEIAASIFQTLAKDGHRPLRRLGPPHDLRALMAVTARRATLDILRAKLRTAHAMKLDIAQKPELLPASEPADPQAAAADAAFTDLPGREAMLARAIYVHRKSYREGGSLAGVPLSNVGAGLARSLKAIRDHLVARKEAR
ncbi:MAG TPA: hypothetical protein VI643_01920 [Planctomycetota bacterium]|nr:hypothetical protein [Planctomycetota bacterium]